MKKPTKYLFPKSIFNLGLGYNIYFYELQQNILQYY